MSGYWPYDQRVEAPTIGIYAFYGADQDSLDRDYHMLSQVTLIYQNVRRIEQKQLLISDFCHQNLLMTLRDGFSRSVFPNRQCWNDQLTSVSD